MAMSLERRNFSISAILSREPFDDMTRLSPPPPPPYAIDRDIER